jgi:hypothetical protein
MEVIHLETACFDQWQVSFSAIQQIGLTFYTFSITDYRTGSRYEHPEVYLTTTKVYLSAYFFCLRASLDREQQPTLLVDLETGYILRVTYLHLNCYQSMQRGLISQILWLSWSKLAP